MSMHPRIHESIAFASVLSLALTLHVAWITNMLVYRVPSIAESLTLNVDIGPVSGLYATTVLAFVVFFVVTILVVRGRDVSHVRRIAFFAFLDSIILFLVMTLPVIYQIGIVVE